MARDGKSIGRAKHELYIIDCDAHRDAIGKKMLSAILTGNDEEYEALRKIIAPHHPRLFVITGDSCLPANPSHISCKSIEWPQKL